MYRGRVPDQPNENASPVFESNEAAPVLSGPTRVRGRRWVSSRFDWRRVDERSERSSLLRLAISFATMGLAVGVATYFFATVPRSPTLPATVMTAGMLLALTFTIAGSRPRVLFRFHPADLLWGVACGLFLRWLQGWTSGANSLPFPTQSSSFGVAEPSWTPLLVALVVPVVEEAFFRGVVLVCVYQALRRRIGPIASAASAAFVSSGAFVLVHAFPAGLSTAASFQLTAVGLTCSALVLLTGRLGGAIATHLAYNLTFVALSYVGSVFS